LNIPSLSLGDFKNVFILESKECLGALECRTIVYSFGKRILETTETHTPIQKSLERFVYSFGFVNGFFTTFLNGFHYLSASEALLATQQLSVIQVVLFSSSIRLVKFNLNSYFQLLHLF
jgi:hypothetical protein